MTRVDWTRWNVTKCHYTCYHHHEFKCKYTYTRWMILRHIDKLQKINGYFIYLWFTFGIIVDSKSCCVRTYVCVWQNITSTQMGACILRRGAITLHFAAKCITFAFIDSLNNSQRHLRIEWWSKSVHESHACKCLYCGVRVQAKCKFVRNMCEIVWLEGEKSTFKFISRL